MFAKPSFLIVVVASLLSTFYSSSWAANVVKDLTPPPSTAPSSLSSTTGAVSGATTLSQHYAGHEIKSDVISHTTSTPLTVTSSSSGHILTTLLPKHHESGTTVHHEAASSSASATAASAASAVLEGQKSMTTMAPHVVSSDEANTKLQYDTSTSSLQSATSATTLNLHKPIMSTLATSDSHLAAHDSVAKVAGSLPLNSTLTSTTMTPMGVHLHLDTEKASAASFAATLTSSPLSNSSSYTNTSAPAHHQQVSPSPSSSYTAVSTKLTEAKAHKSKFCDYMKPICASLDKILAKQLFKIQSQLKQFVQMSNGKLSMCFLEYYELDPNLKEVSKDDLKRICLSKDIPAGKKGSLKDFESCAVKNWDPAIDKEIDRIFTARLNCIKNHNHTSTNNGTTFASVTTTAKEAHAGLENEDDEVSLINDVVSKMFDDDKLSKNTDINVIDMSSKTNSSNLATAISHSSLSASSSSISSAKSKGILNDPNTVVVLVDEGSSTKPTTKAPLAAADKQPSMKDTLPPQHSTTKPTTMGLTEMKEAKVMSKSLTGSESTSSFKSVVTLMTTTLKPLTSLVTKKMEVARKAEASKMMGTTAVPMAGKVVEVEKKVMVGKAMPDMTPLKPTTLKPLETLEEMLKRQEREKMEFENRLRMEREKIFRQIQKKQDEMEAQNAIKALQVQRQASSSSASTLAKAGHDSDEHMHKLEHERQMAIDPIGHTIKHQQYELNKQQRMFGRF